MIVHVFGTLDALDWYGTWKLLDALMACSFDGTWCEYALGNTPEQRFMGVWSDGVPVIELNVTDDPGRRSAMAGDLRTVVAFAHRPKCQNRGFHEHAPCSSGHARHVCSAS